jgi:hypothetical protein
MPTNALGTPAKLFVTFALSLALASCGSNTPAVICNPPSSSDGGTCTCGTGTAACPVSPGPEFLYAYSAPGGRQSSGLILAFRDIRALYFPAGHTDGDSIIFFPKSNVVHMGR